MLQPSLLNPLVIQPTDDAYAAESIGDDSLAASSDHVIHYRVNDITVADHHNSMNIVNQTVSVNVTLEKLSTSRSTCGAHGSGDEYRDMLAHGPSSTRPSQGWNRIRFEERLWGFVRRNQYVLVVLFRRNREKP
ncbi:hypothetical protein AAZX31_16G017800 [Glycine max]